MSKLENLINLNKKRLNNLRHKSKSLIYISLMPLSIFFFQNCQKDPPTSKEEKSIEEVLNIERKQIVDAYYSWSNKLVAQDYAGALSYCVPGSDAEGRTRIHKQTWDEGGQSYDDLYSIEIWLTEEWLNRKYGESVGNTTYYQYVPSWGFVEYKIGFYSSARKIDGRWKIDTFNDNFETDWWK